MKGTRKIRKSITDLLEYELSTFEFNRPYSWTTDNISNLLSDFKSVIDIQNHVFGGKFKYTIGPFILCRNGYKQTDFNYKEKIIIIDGQQRLISFCLLYKYLKPEFDNSLLTQHATNNHLRENLQFISDWFNNNKELEQSFLNLLENTVDVIILISDKDSILGNYDEFLEIYNGEDIDTETESDSAIMDGIQYITKLEEEHLKLSQKIASQVDDISIKISEVSDRINGYQALVEKQLEYATTPDEQERIFHAFSDECVQRIIREIKTKNSQDIYNKELDNLKLTFGDSTWSKLEEDSKTFLVTSKIVFNKLIEVGDVVDYSEACLPVTKALEVEVNKRFYKNYIRFLKTKYPRNDYSMYPTALLETRGSEVKLKNFFTLGATKFILNPENIRNITAEQKKNDKEQLLDYVKSELIKDKSDNEILTILKDFAEDIEKVKNDYRNPSAHTNKIEKRKAEECFDFVIDVERLLKFFIEAFEK